MGLMKDFDIRIRNGGDDAIGAVNELMAELQRRLLEFQESLPRWIPATERLPELMTEVLGWHKDDRVRAWFRHSGTVQGGPCQGTYWEDWEPQDRECDDCKVDKPSHWMPLPAPPTDAK